ncbi:MAG: ATP-binding protein [Bacteroidetes bacterium]|nr:ATP-binding protein [Bacteroidota bacterium]
MNAKLIQRAYEPLEKYLAKGKVLVIYGARRVGKSTLLSNLIRGTQLKYRLDNGDDIEIQRVVGSQSAKQIEEYASGYDLIIIDEAQNIPNIGIGLKIMVDRFPDLMVVATGSSSFDLSNKIGEPLVGRQRILKLFPISHKELNTELNSFDLRQGLENYLLFGSYPEVLTSATATEKIEYLHQLTNSYLLKDILALENIRSPRTLQDLLRLLAYQVGSEVSLHELAKQLRIDIKTVARYLDLLEKSFIILSLGGFSRNLRTEVTSMKKYFFIDIGIRNALINNFNALSVRNDVGQLWENFLLVERLKKKQYASIFSNDYFWRTYSQKEIDLIEERDGKLTAYEFKWSAKKYKAPKEWLSNYPGSDVNLITQENYLDLIL